MSHCSALWTVLIFWYTRPKIYFRILLLFETVQISFLSQLHYHETQLHSVSFREKDWRSFGLHIAQDGIVTTAKISPDLNHILWAIPDIWYCGQNLIFVADMAHVNNTSWMEFHNNWFVYFFGYAYTCLSTYDKYTVYTSGINFFVVSADLRRAWQTVFDELIIWVATGGHSDNLREHHWPVVASLIIWPVVAS